MINVLVTDPLGGLPLNLRLSADCAVAHVWASVYDRLPPALARATTVTLTSGRPLLSTTATVLSDLLSSSGSPDFVTLQITPLILGGKGGFGSQLRAQGGRMAARRKRGNANADDANDSFRNLDGRRMRSIRQAQHLATFLETAPQRIKQEAEQKKQRLLALINTEDPASKIKFDDTEFLEQSEQMIEDLKRIVGESYSYRDEDESDIDLDLDDHDDHANNDKQHFLSAPLSQQRIPKVAAFFDDDLGSDSDEDRPSSPSNSSSSSSSNT
ncbi:telomere stability and silencing-domain-containing protein [Lipomyces japonicus]|uniref:telomere stability and silencing-domain-containing protein n=1 Tax=Lipomyces japonicus TaxID=56871 RepID=UPI0034CF8396